jgi:hypothetical protein
VCGWDAKYESLRTPLESTHPDLHPTQPPQLTPTENGDSAGIVPSGAGPPSETDDCPTDKSPEPYAQSGSTTSQTTRSPDILAAPIAPNNNINILRSSALGPVDPSLHHSHGSQSHHCASRRSAPTHEGQTCRYLWFSPTLFDIVLTTTSRSKRRCASVGICLCRRQEA